MTESILTTNQVAEKLEQWLIEEDDIWKYKKITNPNVFLNLNVTSRLRNITAALDGIHDRVYLVTNMTLDDTQKNAVSLLPALEKNRFRSNLLTQLYQLQINPSIPSNNQGGQD